MDICLTADVYTPGTSLEGSYIDVMTGTFPKTGLKCPCTERTYLTRDKMTQQSH